MELLKVSKDKRALKFIKKRVRAIWWCWCSSWILAVFVDAFHLRLLRVCWIFSVLSLVLQAAAFGGSSLCLKLPEHWKMNSPTKGLVFKVSAVMVAEVWSVLKCQAESTQRVRVCVWECSLFCYLIDNSRTAGLDHGIDHSSWPIGVFWWLRYSMFTFQIIHSSFSNVCDTFSVWLE